MFTVFIPRSKHLLSRHFLQKVLLETSILQSPPKKHFNFCLKSIELHLNVLKLKINYYFIFQSVSPEKRFTGLTSDYIEMKALNIIKSNENLDLLR